PGARLHAAGVGAHQPHPELGGHLGQLGVGPAPRVVEQVGPGLADLAAHLVTPGVDADHQVGVALAYLGHERRGAFDLLPHVDLAAGTGLDPADVDDVGALGHHLVDPAQRLFTGARRAAAVEGAGRTVDDRHHQ